MENLINIPSATAESFWAALQALTERQAETDRQMKETDRKIDKVNTTVGSWSYNQGRFAEEYFFNSFKRGEQSFFGEKFDKIEKNVPGLKEGFKDEYDILLINGKTIGIVEVKHKMKKDHIPTVLRKAVTLRENLPYFANHQIYLGLATFVSNKNAEEECIKKGIAVIKQVGDSVVINDKHLKVY